MDIYEFMTKNQWLTFFLALIIVMLIECILDYLIFKPMNALNIKKHGWPPTDIKNQDKR